MNFNSELPWPYIRREANEAPRRALRHSANSPNLPKIVMKAAGAAFDSVTAKHRAVAAAVADQASLEKPALDEELKGKFRQKKRESARINQPLKLWTIFDVILVIILIILSMCGMTIEWNAISQLLMQADPLKHQNLFTGVLSTGLMLLFPALLKFGAPDVLDNHAVNRRYVLALFLVSFIAALVWLVCFAALNDENPLNPLATQLLAPVLSPTDADFDTHLFFAQMLSQALGSATISAFLFLKAEFIIRTHVSRAKLGEIKPVTSQQVNLEETLARHRSLTGSAARARAILEEIPARREAFLVEWMSRVEAVMDAKAALESQIGPFNINPEDDPDTDA